MNNDVPEDMAYFLAQFTNAGTNFAYELKEGEIYHSKAFSNEGESSSEAMGKTFADIKAYIGDRIGSIYWRRPFETTKNTLFTTNKTVFTTSCRITFIPETPSKIQ